MKLRDLLSIVAVAEEMTQRRLKDDRELVPISISKYISAD
jgi:hypothetical protein